MKGAEFCLGATTYGNDWTRTFDNVLERVKPLKKRPSEYEKIIPDIVNVVSTVVTLPQTGAEKKYRLPLQAMSMRLGPCAQYAPVQFAANIVKLTTSISDTTALMFSSGKIVVVSALTEYHTRYMSHVFRLLAEQVPSMVYDEETGDIGQNTLSGKTVFANNVTHNVVGHGELGCRINLAALLEANPESIKYMPDSFPAAKFSAWLTEDRKCRCKKNAQNVDADVSRVMGKIGKKKCACTIKALIFDTGEIVLIGGRRVEDVNAIFYKMRAMLPKYESTSKVVPREERFYQRIGTMMVKGSSSSSSSSGSAGGGQKKVKKGRELSESEAIASVLTNARKFKSKKPKALSTSTIQQKARLTALMRQAEDGTLDQVQMTLAMEPEQLDMVDDAGNTALQRLMFLERNLEQERIFDFLKRETLSRLV